LDSLLLDPANDGIKEDIARRDRDRLQGVWSYFSGKRKAQLVILGDHFTIRFANGDIYLGTIIVDPVHHPRAMDLYIEEGPDRHRGKTALGIYEFDGDYLIWCPGEPGRLNRLQAFPAEEDLNQLCIVFRREKQAH
jgi:uncharacterized protein (TIGR03067 family)